VQCCADWEQRSIMGDLSAHRLADIWYGQRYTDYRRRFAEGVVKGMICACCRKQRAQSPGVKITEPGSTRPPKF
jgi:hypothetical protein